MSAPALTPPEKKNKLQLAGSLRLLTAPGVRGHTVIFTVATAVLFGIAFLGRVAVGPSQAWTALFAVGISIAGMYFVLSLLTLVDRTQKMLFDSPMRTRAIVVVLIFVLLLGGVAYWIQQAGSVEALPIFPALIAVFYAWVILQAYFISVPVSHLLGRVESKVAGGGSRSRIFRTLGVPVMFATVVPLALAVWTVSSWASSTYQSVQDSGTKIILWSVLMLFALLASYFLVVRWSWSKLRESPQVALFAGGLFLILWGYLLYRGAGVLIGFITENEPSNTAIDSVLIFVSVLGAMQTFARKAMVMANRRFARALPFFVFAFGSVYSVAQFYFILQFVASRVGLSIIVNSIVFVTGLMIMMLMIRKHLQLPLPARVSVQSGAD